MLVRLTVFTLRIGLIWGDGLMEAVDPDGIPSILCGTIHGHARERRVGGIEAFSESFCKPSVLTPELLLLCSVSLRCWFNGTGFQFKKIQAYVN